MATTPTATADQFGDFAYKINLPPDTNTVTITDYTGAGGDVEIPSTIEGRSVSIIGGFAFNNCDRLTSVTIPESVTNIGIRVFSGCTALASITVAAGNPIYSDLDGILCNLDKTVLVAYPEGRAGNYAVPRSVGSTAAREKGEPMIEVLSVDPSSSAVPAVVGQVTVKIRYHCETAVVVKVWARPYTQGEPTASGFYVPSEFELATGEVDRYVGVMASATVDELRVFMKDADTKQSLAEISYPVSLRW